LKHYLEINGYTEVVIESSPFLRTLQTASVVASILKITDMRINYSLAKWMRVKNAKKASSLINPFDKLLIGRQ